MSDHKQIGGYTGELVASKDTPQPSSHSITRLPFNTLSLKLECLWHPDFGFDRSGCRSAFLGGRLAPISLDKAAVNAHDLHFVNNNLRCVH